MATETSKPTGAANQAIVLAVPPAGQTVVVNMHPNQVVEVPFDIAEPTSPSSATICASSFRGMRS